MHRRESEARPPASGEPGGERQTASAAESSGGSGPRSPGAVDRLRAAIDFALLGSWLRTRSFLFAQQRYRYFVAQYNGTWRNERAVEIPIALRYLEAARGGAVLEVGNVLAHYTDVPHDVVDKYERAPGVLNVDVLEFRPSRAYDLVLSISTLEHVGWDEEVQEADKPERAVAHLAEMLAPGGLLLVTLPLGYNPHVDAALASSRMGFSEVRYLRRTSRDNRWRESRADEVAGVRYGSPYPLANAVAVGIRRADQALA